MIQKRIVVKVRGIIWLVTEIKITIGCVTIHVLLLLGLLLRLLLLLV